MEITELIYKRINQIIYQWIALEILYLKSFGFNSIGLSDRTQNFERSRSEE